MKRIAALIVPMLVLGLAFSAPVFAADSAAPAGITAEQPTAKMHKTTKKKSAKKVKKTKKAKKAPSTM